LRTAELQQEWIDALARLGRDMFVKAGRQTGSDLRAAVRAATLETEMEFDIKVLEAANAGSDSE
jgi:hypothetical protein